MKSTTRARLCLCTAVSDPDTSYALEYEGPYASYSGFEEMLKTIEPTMDDEHMRNEPPPSQRQLELLRQWLFYALVLVAVCAAVIGFMHFA